MVSAALHGMPHAGDSHVRARESFVSAVTSRWGRRCLTMISLVMALSAQAVNVWYVDDDNYGKTGLDGTTEAKAFGTLQDAIDNPECVAGDKILVLPGVYDKGGKPLTGYTYQLVNRLTIDKRLDIESTGGRDVTHIVGYHDPDGDKYGCGLNAVRCVGVSNGGINSTLKGFTIRDSATYSGSAESSITNSAGGIYTPNAQAAERIYVTDCAISNCAAGSMAGAVRGGTYVRCIISDCVSGTPTLDGAVARNAAFLNCVIVRNRCPDNETTTSPVPLMYNITAVNCTISGNRSSNMGAGSKLYNCILNCNAADTSAVTAEDTVTTSADGRIQLVGPAVADYRPLSTSAAVGRGKTKWLTTDIPITLPAGTDMRDFEGNDIDLTGETVTAGAYQQTVTPKYGGIYIDKRVRVNGNAIFGPAYFFATKWPMQVRIEPMLEAGQTFFRYKTSEPGLTVYPPLCDRGTRSRYLQEDGGLYLTPPAFAGQVLTNTQVLAKRVYYVQAGVAAGGSGTSTNDPLPTIQAAVDKVTSNGENNSTLILVGPGDYNEGSTTAQGVKTRVVIPDLRHILVRSTGGAAVTTIRGKADSNPVDSANYPGLGPNAERCVAVLGSSGVFALQGFTLADGHTDLTNTGASTTADSFTLAQSSGGFYGPSSTAVFGTCQILDCVITNCGAFGATAISYAWASRCKIFNCRGANGNIVRKSYLSSCLIANCTTPDNGYLIYKDTLLQNCTVPGLVLNGSAHHYNCVFGKQSRSLPGNAQDAFYWGSVFDKGNYGANSPSAGYTFADPLFFDKAGGDWRVLSGSPALDSTCRWFPDEDTDEWATFATNFAQFATSDLNGKPWRMGGDFPCAGAWQEAVQSVVLDAPADQYVVVGGTVGTNALAARASISVSRKPNPARNVQGVSVNGVTNLFTDLDGGVWTFTAGDEATQKAVSVEPVTVPDWYVSPFGNDANDGCSRATPKQSLAAALGMAIAGDTVHAAAGSYEIGTMTVPSGVTSETSVPARAVVKSGVSLVSDDGAATTFITGAAGTEYADAYSCGSNAVRCVALDDYAVVRGFTLRNGHAFPCPYPDEKSAYDSDNDFNCGGAFGYGPSARHYAHVQDCVITNCSSYNGSAARLVAIVNTKIVGNRAKRGVTSECDFYGAVVDGNYADQASVHSYTLIFDSTIGPNAYKLDGSAGYALGTHSGNFSMLANTIVLGKYTSKDGPYAPTNCVFIAGAAVSGADLADRAVNSIVTNIEALAIGEDLRPLARSIVCDKACESAYPRSAYSDLWPKVDEWRNARRTNGALDIGALEADWRGVYAFDIGGRAMEVLAATTNVVESENRTVMVNPGQSLEAVWRGKDNGRISSFVLPLRVTGTGTLSVTINGETRTFTAADGEAAWNFKSALTENEVLIAYDGDDGYAEILNGGRSQGFGLSFR